MIRFNVTNVLSAVFLIYIGHSIYTLYLLFTPVHCTGDHIQCLQPALIDNNGALPLAQIRVYVSSHKTLSKSSEPIFAKKQMDLKEEINEIVETSVPNPTRNNGSFYAHVYLLPDNFDGADPTKAFWVVQHSVPIYSYTLPQAVAFQLMGGVENNTEKLESPSKKRDSKNPVPSGKPVTHIRSVIPLESVPDGHSFHWNQVPGEIANFFRLDQNRRYLPLFFVNEMGFRVKDLVHVTKDTEKVNLTISYKTCSIGKLRLMQTALRSLDSLKALGFTDKDCDEVKGIFVDTNFYFLALTFFVAAVHILLDFLAFKNDINFWRGRKTTVGLSTRTLLWRCFSQSVIFLYLLDEETSLLVLIPAGIGTVIEFWKVKKAYKMQISIIGGFPRIRFGVISKEEAETEGFDQQGMIYVAYILTPLCIGGALYSLLYTPHKSWYSWLIQSMANGVYAFGFIFMLPQLFVNYKLKSVAHLPWRAFTYKAFNTFIDDLFAFIIHMPTAHRLACFRDDIVFVVYLYQRYLYPVDKTRVNEFGESFEGKEGEKEDKKTK